MIYGLEQSTGILYTEEEWWDTYRWMVPDHGLVMDQWDRLPHVDVEPERIEEARKNFLFIYTTKPSPRVGDIIVSPNNTADKWVVESIINDKMMVANVSWSNNIYQTQWEGPYLLLHSCSLMDAMRPYQILYNTAMSKLGKINLDT